jgi:hypothetical protein
MQGTDPVFPCTCKLCGCAGTCTKPGLKFYWCQKCWKKIMTPEGFSLQERPNMLQNPDGFVVVYPDVGEEYFFKSKTEAELKMAANSILKKWDASGAATAVYNEKTHLIKRLGRHDPSPLGFIMLQPLNSGWHLLPSNIPFYVAS